MSDLTLFDQVSTAQTRHAAAESVKDSAETMRQRVFQEIADHGPLCDEQIAANLRMNPSTERPRRLELLRDGRIRPALLTVRTASGRQAISWEIVPAT